MALKYQVDSVDDLPEPLREHYREDGGKFYLDAEGLKPAADLEKLNAALQAERKVSKQFKDSASVYESKFAGKGSPDEILSQLERIPLLEAESQGKWDQKKHQEVLDQTVKQRVSPLEHEIAKLKQSVMERENEIASFKASDRRRSIHDAVRQVAAKEGFQENAYASSEGALMLLAERHLTLNSLGQVVVSDDNNTYTPGLGLTEALGQIKQQHPYLLKQSIGGGASGSSGAGGAQSNPFKQNNKTLRGKFMKENPDTWQKKMSEAGLSNPAEEYTGK